MNEKNRLIDTGLTGKKISITYPKTNVGEFIVILESDENEKVWNYKIWSFGKDRKEDLYNVKPDYRREDMNLIFAVSDIIAQIEYHFILKNKAEIIEKLISDAYQKISFNGKKITDWLQFVKDFKTESYYSKELLTLYIKHCENEAMFDKVEDNYSWAKRIVNGVKDFKVNYKNYTIWIIYNYRSDKFYYQIDDKKIHETIINSFRKEEHTGANNALEAAYKYIKNSI